MSLKPLKLLATIAILQIASSASTPYSTNILAMFDDASGPLIDVYDSMLWNGMRLVNIDPSDTQSGVIPDSPNQYALYHTLDDATSPHVQPAISVDYVNSTHDKFDLYSFYYGCAKRTGLASIGAATNCTITVQGYADVNGVHTQLVAQPNFTYSVGAAEGQKNMGRADLEDAFKGVNLVQFFVDKDADTAVLVDTVAYTVYSKIKSRRRFS